MTLLTARGFAVDRDYARVLAGQRLHSRPEVAFFLAGKPLPEHLKPAEKREKAIALTPGALTAKWISITDLDRLADADEYDFAESERYLSVTGRLRRLEQLRKYFGEFRVSLAQKPRPGIILPLELPLNHMPRFEILDAIDEPPNLSAWLKADNDNEPPEEGEVWPAHDPQRRIRPGSSDAELRSFIRKAGPTMEHRHARDGGGGDIDVRPVDATWQNIDAKRKKVWPGKIIVPKALARVGTLRIASGEAFVGKHRVEAGTILHQDDRFGETMGPKRGKKERAELERSNIYFRRLMSFDPATGTHAVSVGTFEFKKAGKVRREVIITAEERAAIFAGPLPPVTYCPPGLPCGGPRLADNFLGGWASATKGRQTPERWQDLADEMARQEEFKAWWKQLPADERKALRTAMKRPTLKAVGEAFGKTGKNAERAGKKILVAANQNLKLFQAA